mgnify:CR=1 FL=1
MPIDLKNTAILNGLFLALFASFMFSLKTIFIKQAYDMGIESSGLMLLRMWFAFPFYAVILFMQRKALWEKRQYILSILTIGFLGYFLSSYLDLLALETISAQAERIILYAYPSIVVLLKAISDKKMPSPRMLTALAVVYMGLLFLLPGELNIEGSAFGLTLMLICACTFAFYVFFSKPLIEKVGISLFTSTAMVSSCLFTQVNLIKVDATQLLNYSHEIYILALGLAFFCTVLPSYAMNAAIAKIGPEKVAIAGTTGPIFTVILAVIILGETMSIYHGAGLTLVMIGVYLLKPKKIKN